MEKLKEKIIKILEEILPQEKPELVEITEELKKYNLENNYPPDYTEPIKKNQGWNECLAEIKQRIKNK